MSLPAVGPLHVSRTQMGRDLHQISLQVVHGLLPVLLVELVHAGHDCASDCNVQLVDMPALIGNAVF